MENKINQCGMRKHETSAEGVPQPKRTLGLNNAHKEGAVQTPNGGGGEKKGKLEGEKEREALQGTHKPHPMVL